MLVTIFWRTVLFYAVLLVTVRVMGKREIGALDPFDFVVAILLAELAAIPIEEVTHPVWTGLVAIGTLLALQLLSSWLCLVDDRARRLICGEPSVVVRTGRLQEHEMRKLRYNIHDLMAQLRQKGVPDISDVEVAVLENNGQLSVVPRSQKRPVAPSDLQVPTPYESLPITVVVDGSFNYKEMRQSGVDFAWVEEKLREQGVEDVSTLLYAHVDTQGNVRVQRKGESEG
ncbi:YetF domain-containing protein [Limnochorda pilosa]|uniref:Membrane protein n=1 Tax=Limnochorda pilosa TaxID=1555112 RepID=A0A0K2SPD1_LIMPI|nr:DUF421 domain-containing protein [Limnochorda pilosa]BAS28998.1 membrane protein [Limnochorda pilosa]